MRIKITNIRTETSRNLRLPIIYKQKMEDIDDLIANSQTHKYLLFIDSKSRDRLVFPNPEAYTIYFSEPLKNVHSVKVIDSSIPRTHYNVSTVSNNLVYRIKEANWQVVTIPPGNYNIDELIIILNEELKNIKVFHLSYPTDIRKQLVFKSKQEFEIDVKSSSLKYTLGLDCASDYGYESIVRTDEQIIVRSIDNFAMYEQHSYADRLSAGTDDMYSINHDTILYMSLHALDKNIVLQKISFGISNVSERCSCVISVIQLTNVGKFVLQSSIIGIDTTIESIDAYFEESTLSPNSDTYISISFKNFQYGVDSFSCVLYTSPSESKDTALFSMRIQDNVLLTTDTINGFSTDVSLNVNITYSIPQFSIIAPGMYNMIGDSYVTLRCTELDQHMGSINSSNYSDGTGQVVQKNFDYGLAVFKLGLVGYQDEKFDNTFIDRDFFPIGKLSQLSFRFERWDGSLYDFKGINHTFTLQVKYYAAKIDYEARSNWVSSLNPDHKQVLGH